MVKSTEDTANEILNELSKSGPRTRIELRRTCGQPELAHNIILIGRALRFLMGDEPRIVRCTNPRNYLFDKFKLVTRDDIEVIEKMASKAREKVDALEKRIEELEKKKSK